MSDVKIVPIEELKSILDNWYHKSIVIPEHYHLCPKAIASIETQEKLYVAVELYELAAVCRDLNISVAQDYAVHRLTKSL